MSDEDYKVVVCELQYDEFESPLKQTRLSAMDDAFATALRDGDIEAALDRTDEITLSFDAGSTHRLTIDEQLMAACAIQFREDVLIAFRNRRELMKIELSPQYLNPDNER